MYSNARQVVRRSLLALVPAAILLVWAGGHMPVVQNTCWLVAGTLALALPIGSLLAFLLSRTDLPGRRLFGLLLVVLVFLPLYLQAAGWLAGFGLQGWYTQIYGGAPWLDSWRGAIWIHAAAAIPWVTLIVAAGLLFVEPELEEDALLDASPAVVLCRVTLPRAAGSVGVAGLWVAILTAGDMTVTDFFQIRTYAEEIYVQISTGARIVELTVGWLPTLIVVATLCAAALACCAAAAPAIRWPSWRRTVTFRLGVWRWPLAIMVAFALAMLIGLPLQNLLYKAGVVTDVASNGEDLVRRWSLAKALRIVITSPVAYASEFFWSFLIGSIAATAALVGGVFLAWLSRRGGGAGTLVLSLCAGLLALPGPLLGLLIIWAFNRPEVPWLADLYDYSIFAPCTALVLRSLPLVVLILWPALRSVPQEILESATMDGAAWWERLAFVALPQRAGSLAAAWLVAFAISLGDLAASILVVPPGVVTLPIQIFGKLHYGQEDDVAGICLVLILGMFLAVDLAMLWLTRRHTVASQ